MDLSSLPFSSTDSPLRSDTAIMSPYSPAAIERCTGRWTMNDGRNALMIRIGALEISKSLCPEDQIDAHGNMICDFCGENQTHWTLICDYWFDVPFYETFVKPSERFPPTPLAEFAPIGKSTDMINHYIDLLRQEHGSEVVEAALQKGYAPSRCSACGDLEHTRLACPLASLTRKRQYKWDPCEACGDNYHSYNLCTLKDKWPASRPIPPGFTFFCGFCNEQGVECHGGRFLGKIYSASEMALLTQEIAAPDETYPSFSQDLPKNDDQVPLNLQYPTPPALMWSSYH